MATSIVERFIPLFLRLFPLFEPLIPSFTSFFLKRKLREWKNKGLIDDYKTKTRRIGKLHYRMDVDFALTPEQARNISASLVAKIFRRR